ncbi:hypothetical protein [Burkholderia sp. BCC0322]|uniref:hypothetical protein n=1 Tax=unclassified Burkholderia TaxID=2613784 RepID=UPI00158A428E|nr:hypothetical protein [Burkholderia sp. BCC0322]
MDDEFEPSVPLDIWLLRIAVVEVVALILGCTYALAMIDDYASLTLVMNMVVGAAGFSIASATVGSIKWILIRSPSTYTLYAALILHFVIIGAGVVTMLSNQGIQ